LEDAVRHGQPALLQNSFSLLDRTDETEVVPFCAEHGISYVPFGPLSGGWLTGKYRRGEPYPEGSRMTMRPGPYARLVDDRVFDGLDRLGEEADARGIDLPALAFGWVLARVDGAVCGPNRVEQLDPILVARELKLSSDDVDRIGRFFE
jgi:aryl-alcohol dehydrogenase-like predicted oxidoreductase